ncbi:hypothetical protein [Limnobacter sp.]|uniref:hypothetical protein n=1 Tax=Limnobacter sp. TaxID=2003368 RepID=UPI003518D3DF
MVLALGIARATDLLTPAKEIALIIGEPWKDMQARSSAKIADDIPNEIWYRMPKELAYLRFADRRYGFVTPPAKFFTVSFDENAKIRSARMSPQTEPLPLDEALKVVLDLQEQWRRGGWVLADAEGYPPYADTAWWREQILACVGIWSPFPWGVIAATNKLANPGSTAAVWWLKSLQSICWSNLAS